MKNNKFELIGIKDEEPKKNTTVLVSFSCSEKNGKTSNIHDCIAYMRWDGSRFFYSKPSKYDKFRDAFDHYIDGMFRKTNVKVDRDSVRWFKQED